MTDHEIMLARFTISEAAKREIESMRADWNARFADPADVVAVSWAEWRPRSGEPSWNVLVSFYSRSQRDEIARGIQQVSGLPVLLFTLPAYATEFDGKTLDYASGRGFFLRTR